MTSSATPKRILHVFSTFKAAGPQIRACTLMKALGDNFSHLITALDEDFSATAMLDCAMAFQILMPPVGKGRALYSFRLWDFISRLRPDLVLTYNWGAIEAAAVCGLSRIGPVIHAEDGFGPDEALRLKTRRVWTRRLVLNTAFKVVVPSLTLKHIALQRYRIGSDRVSYIANGVDTEHFRVTGDSQRNWALRQAWGIADSACLFGYVGRLGEEKKLDLLLRAFAKANPPNGALVLIGDGPCLSSLRELAAALGIGRKVVFAGSTVTAAPYYRALDAFTLSSATEQMPMAMLEAMSSSLPVISTAVGDAPLMLGDDQPAAEPVVVPTGDVAQYANSLNLFASDIALRSRLGAENRLRCLRRYTLRNMVYQYSALYSQACGLTPPLPFAEADLASSRETIQ